jgi:hypothetical protein
MAMPSTSILLPQPLARQSLSSIDITVLAPNTCSAAALGLNQDKLFSYSLKLLELHATPLFLQADRVGSGKCLFFVRVNPKGVSEKSIESDIAAGEIQGSALDTFKALVADLYLPVLQEQGSWGKMAADHTQEFLAGMVATTTTALGWPVLHTTGGATAAGMRHGHTYDHQSSTCAAYKTAVVTCSLF